ncbi:MAG: hypothetical protein HY000_29330 [Planctomycetes bacterium]|nr:hypothetical protein [Planctomycetota bacterium]
MGDTLAIMITMTTYGTWLRGDARGWVDRGIVFPPDPELEAADRARMKYPEFRFRANDWLRVGEWIGRSLRERLQIVIWAMTVQSWHVHLVIPATPHPISRAVKCAKDAVRWGSRLDRPIWSDGYDKRFCFDEASALGRIAYVERHNVEVGRSARPWDFISVPAF